MEVHNWASLVAYDRCDVNEIKKKKKKIEMDTKHAWFAS